MIVDCYDLELNQSWTTRQYGLKCRGLIIIHAFEISVNDVVQGKAVMIDDYGLYFYKFKFYFYLLK